MRDIITASQAAIAGINTAFIVSQVAREEVNTEADAFFERGGTTISMLRGGTAISTLRGDGGTPPSQRARLGQAYGGGRGGAGAPPSQPARQRPQSQRIRAATTAALRLTRGGRARGNESTVNIYGSYGVAYGGAYDPDAW